VVGGGWCNRHKRLPRRLVLQRPKRGFTPPIRSWQAAIAEKYGRLLDDGELVNRQILDPTYARGEVDYRAKKAHELTVRHRWLILELWCRGMLNEASRLT